MTTNKKELKKELEYHKNELFKIAMSFNPNFEFGAGLKNKLLNHREQIERLEEWLK